MKEGVYLFNPDLIIRPFLKERIPDDIWKNHTCIIIYPRVKEDKGLSSIEWSILEDLEEWRDGRGITALQAADIMDTGDILGSRTFKHRPISKSRMYRHEMTETSILLIHDVVTWFYKWYLFTRTTQLYQSNCQRKTTTSYDTKR